MVPCSDSLSAATLRRATMETSVVQLDRHVRGSQVDFVGSDNEQAIRTAVDYLHRRGARTFAFVGSSTTDSSTQHRRAAYEAAVRRVEPAGVRRVLVGDYSLAWGVHAVGLLGDAGRFPDAVVCGADVIALGVISALRGRGLRVPDDVAVTGFDDIRFAEVSEPPLTTLRQPAELIAAEAVDILLRRTEGDDGPARHTLFEAELVVRGTTP